MRGQFPAHPPDLICLLSRAARRPALFPIFAVFSRTMHRKV